MNKKEVNDDISYAYDAIKYCKIAKDNKITKTFRGQISTFGAAVTMGSLKPAVLFFSDQGGASVQRTNLMQAILFILVKGDTKQMTGSNEKPGLYDYIRGAEKSAGENAIKEKVLDAAIALKLAMNLYELVGSETNEA